MQELNFSITINLSLTLKENKASINIKNVDLIPAVISLPARLNSRDRTASSKTQKKKTIHDIILQTAKKYVDRYRPKQVYRRKAFSYSAFEPSRIKKKYIRSAGNCSRTQSLFPPALSESKGLFLPTWVKGTTSLTKSIWKLAKTR